MGDILAYGGLLLSALVAATILPAQSEGVFAALLLRGTYQPWALLAAASVGNVLGSVVNWGLGRGLLRFQSYPWFPVTPARLGSAADWYRRFGRWSLLASWMPVIGDPLTLAAGVLREPFWSFLAIVTVAKVGRYLVLMMIVSKWL
ncbi:YqaA family protein [Mesorhizobium sp. LjNodule214]|uniref:YqaA family protein n=1 Tax=Mesorhizobium sp. LjNodule214 TaxID=3342252 RepID=UPI003ECD186F